MGNTTKHTKDVTLLGKWHMGLSLKKAWTKIEEVLDNAKKLKATVTILWHTNTFGVHNYWGSLYEKILQRAKKDGAIIMKCAEACDSIEKN